ncbi:unnamed protein product [Rotaria magnacalcarata]|uniref:Uncharacterized protein n=1 Tax=Rotaria magnacalcarata TaxID=392030 RepID=A0A816LYF9_9BILA|nr:unnamed protein product [Rotaria magnacalcarata]CAF3802091.1 unnamed protein product [Rotaria magnacalcarata]
MVDILRVFLIAVFSLSIPATPVLFTFQGLFQGFTLDRIITAIILSSVQINFVIVLCLTTNFKKLKIFNIINTVIIFILFIIELIALQHFVDHSRQKFHELIEKYPDGSVPDDWNLMIYYHAIKDRKCCGIDKNKNLSLQEIQYFYRNFASNCLKFLKYFTINATEIYHHQPCMHFVYDLRYIVVTISAMKVLTISFMMTLFWAYVQLDSHQRNRIVQPFTEIPSNQIKMYPSSASDNYPSKYIHNTTNVSK